MSTLTQHITENARLYITTAIVGLAVSGALAYLDARHVSHAHLVEEKLEDTRLEIRQQINYLELAPSEQYDPARKANLRELEDKEKALESKLESLR